MIKIVDFVVMTIIAGVILIGFTAAVMRIDKLERELKKAKEDRAQEVKEGK